MSLLNLLCLLLLRLAPGSTLVRLFEQSICNRHFRSTPSAGEPVNEESCKIPEVQDMLANVVGVKMSVDALPGEPLFLFSM